MLILHQNHCIFALIIFRAFVVVLFKSQFFIFCFFFSSLALPSLPLQQSVHLCLKYSRDSTHILCGLNFCHILFKKVDCFFYPDVSLLRSQLSNEELDVEGGSTHLEAQPNKSQFYL